jgi:hypothetical protein
LESNQRRMKKRLESILGNKTDWPKNLHIFVSWPRGDEAINQLEHWMILHPETKLIVGDIMVNLRPTRNKLGDPYDDDSALMQAFSQFACNHNICVLLIHHTRKNNRGGDPFDELLGSVGIQGGVDTMLKIENDLAGSLLMVRGRDIEDDRPKPIRWDPSVCSWVITAQQEMPLGKTRYEILSLFIDAGEDLSAGQVCEHLPHIDKDTIYQFLRRMKGKELYCPQRGKYRLADKFMTTGEVS